MAGKAKFVFIASMDVDPAKEALFNEVYDTEHVPELLKVPGVLSIRRAVSVPLTMFIGGEKKTIVAEGEPRYSAYYELESAEVLTSSAWAKAVELGRWPGEVRPFTRNRRHVLRKISYAVFCLKKKKTPARSRCNRQAIDQSGSALAATNCTEATPIAAA